MFEIQNYGTFIMAVVLFQLFPGPGMMTILNATAQDGVKSGMKAVLGTLSGDFTYMLAAVLGLAAILDAQPGILKGAQWLGVGYLCWTGLKMLRATVAEQPIDRQSTRRGWAYFRWAFAISLTNPKAIMFFLAFFPLFLNADFTPLTLFVLMMHVTVISFIIQASLVLVGNAAAFRLSQWKYAGVVFSRLTGVAFIGFGIKLALDNR